MPDSDKLTDEDPMPVFPIKAKDNLAPDTIRHYGMLCRERGLHEQHTQVILAGSEIDAWRSRNPDALKDPDHKHVAARGSVTLPNEREAALERELAALRRDRFIAEAKEREARLASLETSLREARTRLIDSKRRTRYWQEEAAYIEDARRAALSAAPSTGEEALTDAQIGHAAYADPVGGGWDGYEAACHDCDWRSGRLHHPSPYGKDAASTDAMAHVLDAKAAAIAAYRGVGEAK